MPKKYVLKEAKKKFFDLNYTDTTLGCRVPDEPVAAVRALEGPKKAPALEVLPPPAKSAKKTGKERKNGSVSRAARAHGFDE